MAYESKYFKTDELVCKCCGQLPDGGINKVLLDKLDELREACGEPLSLSCCYRCPSHNREVGGVSNSQHTIYGDRQWGNAADVLCPDDMSVDELADRAVGVGFDGIGRYYNSGFVHVDVRDNGDSPNGYTWSDL